MTTINNEPNIWICPVNPKNLKKTIINKYNGENIWALNARRKKSFDNLKIGDICLFGRLRDGEGLIYMGIVKSKKILREIEDDWPFKSPSGVFWKYAFTMSMYKIEISPDKARELRGWDKTQSWQTQSKLENSHSKKFIDYLYNNYPEYFEAII
jgi:hypothetical protein